MRLVRKHSLPTRLFHWINVPVLAVMIWSGLLIFWAYDVGAGGATTTGSACSASPS